MNMFAVELPVAHSMTVIVTWVWSIDVFATVLQLGSTLQ
jgi:hypothetical protein